MPTVTATKTSAQADTAVALRAVVGKLSKRLNALSRGTGMTQAQLSVLGSVARHGPVRLTELADLETMNPTMLSRVVAALDDQGLVRRNADPHDRRAGQVEVTAAGRRTHDRLRAQRGRIITDGLGQLSVEEVQDIERALPALERLVETVVRQTSAKPVSRR